MDSSKTNMDSLLLLLLPNNIQPPDGFYVVIELSDLASYKKFFHLSQMLIICYECRKNMKVGIK